MKHIYSFLAGVASISLTVFLTRSLPGYMFLAGFCVCSLSVVLLGRVIGAGRLARFFLRLSQPNSFRLASHWSSDAKGLPTARRVATTSDSSRSVPRLPGTGEDSRQRVKEIRMRRDSRTAQDGNNRGVVNSVDVLSSVQQDVLSALVNLKVPYSQAEEAIRGARGQSFDELFREALTSVNAGAGKSRRAVA